VIWPNGLWRSLEEVELATLEWVDWFNSRRPLEPIGDFPPAEFEEMYYERLESPALEAGLNQTSLRDSRCGSDPSRFMSIKASEIFLTR
jgi:hypothetical protein